MKTGRTLEQLAAELDRRNKSKRDFIVSSAAMRMGEGAGRQTAVMELPLWREWNGVGV